MWLYMIAFALLIVGLVGGVLTGGIFLIIFIPLGLIALAAAAASAMAGRSAERRSSARSGRSAGPGQPLPHSQPESPGHVPSSPDALVDERRVQQ